jgi:hypothetical protein
MIIDHSHCLHESIADRWTREFKPVSPQILAQGLGFGRLRRNIFRRLTFILLRPATNESPDILVETAELLLQSKERFCIPDGSLNLQPISYDILIRKQLPDLALPINCNGGGVKVIEGSTVATALSQDSFPAQACLHTLQDEKFEQGSIIMDRHTPFKIMIVYQSRSAGPLTTVHFTSILYNVRPDSNTPIR